MRERTQSEFDVIVAGGGVAGAVCAATLSLRGLSTLLIAETANLGHNVRSPVVDGHRGILQVPWWHYAWGGGNWARVIREQNLPARVHHHDPIDSVSVRGSKSVTTWPMVMSAKGVCDLLLQLLPFPDLDERSRQGLERVFYAGLQIPADDLFAMHDVPITRWLEDLKADPLAQMIVLQLGAALTGVPTDQAGDYLSVFGVWCGIRAVVGGEGTCALIEPDSQLGLVEPLGQQVERFGGAVWRGVKIDQVLLNDNVVAGVRLQDGTEAFARNVALAVGNSRLPAIFEHLPEELVEPLEKERPLALKDMFVVAVLREAVVDIPGSLLIFDPPNMPLWLALNSTSAPWNSPDDRQCCRIWSGLGPQGSSDVDEVYKYQDEVLEEYFPGWTDAVETRTHILHTHHWLNPCFTGAKVPRQSPSVGGLWYVGEGTSPVRGLGFEQAAHAGYDGALTIAAELGNTELDSSLLFPALGAARCLLSG